MLLLVTRQLSPVTFRTKSIVQRFSGFPGEISNALSEPAVEHSVEGSFSIGGLSSITWAPDVITDIDPDSQGVSPGFVQTPIFHGLRYRISVQNNE
jgi:hypothetical protein